jgi:hypothetical protein
MIGMAKGQFAVRNDPAENIDECLLDRVWK